MTVGLEHSITMKEEKKSQEECAETLQEPPSSWHHGARLKCLQRKSSTSTRVGWFCSSIALVFVQMCVMLSFLSALGTVRCTDHDDCLNGAHCSRLNTMPRAKDPLHPSRKIRRGVCMGCSSKAPTDELVDDLLEVLCPGGPGAVSNPSVGLLCIQSCMDTCTGASFSMADTHLSDYTDGQRSCASTCSLGMCASTLTGGLADKFDAAAGGPGWRDEKVASGHVAHAYSVWLNIHNQCNNCAESLIEGVRFGTPNEAENLKILKMSFLDFVSLGLASLIVALTIMREVRDLNIGQMMTIQAVHRDRDRDEKEEKELGPNSLSWRWALGLQAFFRRYIILTDVAMVVVLMVTRFGGDTVSIMLSA